MATPAASPACASAAAKRPRLRWNWSKSKSASSFARSEATKQSRLRVNRSGLLRFARTDPLEDSMAQSQEVAVSSSHATTCDPDDPKMQHPDSTRQNSSPIFAPHMPYSVCNKQNHI